MQDIQNIPNPDVEPMVEENDFGNHSDIEREDESGGIENIPLPPDQKPPAPVREPPDSGKAPIGDDNSQPGQLV